jgi:hypothetical protein
MTRRFTLLLILIVAHPLIVASAVAADRVCTPDIAWPDVPPKIRTQLTQAVGGEISPQHGPFNATDVIEDATPRSRFFGACREANQWIIAIERGGIGYHLQVFQFSGHALADKWTGFVPSAGFTPKSLDRPDKQH